MQKHTKIYLNHFDIGEQDFVYDEVEWSLHNRTVRAVDIHHISPRGMGGSKEKDNISNLMALSRKNHNKAEDKTYPEAMLQEVHNHFMANNPYQKYEKV